MIKAIGSVSDMGGASGFKTVWTEGGSWEVTAFLNLVVGGLQFDGGHKLHAYCDPIPAIDGQNYRGQFQ